MVRGGLAALMLDEEDSSFSMYNYVKLFVAKLRMTVWCPAGDTQTLRTARLNHPFPRSSAHALDVHAVLFWAHYCHNCLDKNISCFMNYFKECLELFLKNT